MMSPVREDEALLKPSQTQADINALKTSAADTAKKAAGVIHHQFEKHPNARAAGSTAYLAGAGYLGHMICCIGSLASVPLAMIGFDLVHKGVKKASNNEVKAPVVETMGQDRSISREEAEKEAAVAATPVKKDEDAPCYKDMPYTELNVANCIAAKKGEEVSCADIITGPIGYGLGKVLGLFSAKQKADAAAVVAGAGQAATSAVVTTALKPSH